MKVKIKTYPTYLGPQHTVELLFRWASKPGEFGRTEYPEWVENIGDWYADSWLGKWHTAWASRYESWCERRRVSVKIDSWDTWSMDHTLAYIVLPMLIQLKNNQHGAGYVDDSDVPEHLQSHNGVKPDEYDVDSLHFARWEWVLDEMIFAFDSKAGAGQDWEEQFHTGNIDFEFVPVDVDGDPCLREDAKWFEMRKTDLDTSHFDKEGYEKYQARINNGFRLFGKYYNNLWD